MAMISLICLLALSSSALGRSSYGSFQEPTRDMNTQQRTILTLPTTNQAQSGYGQQSNTFSTGSYGSQGDFMAPRTVPSLPEPVPQKWTNAEMQCRGQRPGTIIPLDNGRRWISCLEEDKAVEQACPRNLFYNLESRRCERRVGQLENPCVSQPCLNNGQCLPIDSSSFECKCGAGFDGTFCELDARVCQTQQPCGQAPGTRCQSFRSGAALQYVCIHQNELAYGFNAQQVQPSPCQNIDGTLPLGISDKGFVMCDGERMFVESCPGGTIWEDINKACVWPDMQGTFGTIRTIEPVKDYSYGQQKSVPTSSYTAPALPQQRTLEPVSSYGQNTMQRTFEQTSLPVPSKQSYGAQQTLPKTFDLPVQQGTSSYGNQEPAQTQQIFQQPIQKSQEFFPVQQATSSYGSQQFQKQPEFRSFQKSSSY